MCERFEAAKAVEVLNIDWLHTEEQVTHTELFVTQYEAQLNKTKPRPPHDCHPAYVTFDPTDRALTQAARLINREMQACRDAGRYTQAERLRIAIDMLGEPAFPD